ncbi:multimerin-2-like [Thunnus albacares]|uniref:multimerin-2-like n=1 Tax=Thunnus albacares TaxID=8236 RepID=UPI001CF6CA2C|nr:multimerin-2-like [Thunnus albacares]
MSSTKICSALDIVTVLCVTSLIVARPVELIPSQTAARQEGAAVLFFAACQGQLREVQFNPIIFNQVSLNQGSAYNNDTGVFTAPVAGIYQFVFAAQLCRGDHNNMWYLTVNGKEKMLCHAQVSGSDTTLNTCYLMEALNIGDQVWVKQSIGSCAWASTTSKTITFSGMLLASGGASKLGEEYISGSTFPPPSLDSNRSMEASSAGPSATLSSMAVALLLLCLVLD